VVVVVVALWTLVVAEGGGVEVVAEGDGVEVVVWFGAGVVEVVVWVGSGTVVEVGGIVVVVVGMVKMTARRAS
jgi:hypothetical protein